MVLCLCMAITVFALSCIAEDEIYECFTYRASENSVTITGFDGSVTTVIIPAEINGLPVTAIADAAF